MTITWCPHDDYHSAVKPTNRDEPLFAVVGSIVFSGEGVTRKNFAAARKIQPTLPKGIIAFRRIENNRHFCYYKNL